MRIIAILAMVLWPSIGAAQSLCLQAAVFKSMMKRGEYAMVGRGNLDAGGTFEVFQNETSWVAIVTSPRGTTCILALGTSWKPNGEKISFRTSLAAP